MPINIALANNLSLKELATEIDRMLLNNEGVNYLMPILLAKIDIACKELKEKDYQVDNLLEEVSSAETLAGSYQEDVEKLERHKEINKNKVKECLSPIIDALKKLCNEV